MKTAILATTLATTAALPNFDKLMKVEAKELIKQAKANKMDPKEVVKQAVAERVITEQQIGKDGQLSVQSHDMNYFEFAAGVAGCDMASRDETFGIRTYHCWDSISQKDDNEEEGWPYSYMYFKPGNDGFPLVATFRGHGCNFENGFHFGRMRKASYGFPGTYSPWHGCYAHQDESGNDVFHMGASWTTGPSMEYDGMIFSISRSNKACYRGNVGSYGTMRANRCIAWEEDDGLWKSEIVFVNTCYENWFDVDIEHFNDESCQIFDHAEKLITPEVCLFDLDHFKDSIIYDGAATFEYSNYTCSQATTTLP
jgi:hypothetical protein